MDDADFFRSCARALMDHDPARRLSAAEILLSNGALAKDARPALKLAEDDADARVRTVAKLAIAAIDGNPEALKEGLFDRTADVRRACALACGALGEAAAPLVPRLIELLADNDAAWAAARSLGELHMVAASAISALIAVASSPNEELRLQAIQSLAAFGSRARTAAPAFSAALHDDSGRVRVAAALATWHANGDATSLIPTFVDALRADDAIVRDEAALALAEMGAAAAPAEQALTNALDDEDDEVRADTARALAAIRKPPTSM